MRGVGGTGGGLARDDDPAEDEDGREEDSSTWDSPPAGSWNFVRGAMAGAAAAADCITLDRVSRFFSRPRGLNQAPVSCRGI